MDTDKLRRRQSLKVIISEACMVIVVIITVIILAFIVSGYWLNSDFEVERQGMLQISSIPTGADLIVDDAEPSWFQRTNTSKILATGEHEITLTKDGYDSWSRTINISEGLLYRIHYPRLFLTEREREKVLNTAKFTFASVAPNAKIMLLIGDTTEWTLAKLDNEQIKTTPIDITSLLAEVPVTNTMTDTTAVDTATADSELPDPTTPAVFAGQILTCDWDKNSEHALLQIALAEHIEWILIDIANVKNSINLTQEFDLDFSQIKIFDNSASSLLAVENQTLREIDTKNQTISTGLVRDLLSFDYFDNDIVFTAASQDSKVYLGTLKNDNTEVEELFPLPASAQVVILQFYDIKYLAILSDSQLTLYTREDLTEVANFDLTFSPAEVTVGHQGEFITMVSDNLVATLDMEDRSVREWSVDGATFDWLTSDMFFSVKDGELFVYDFDGLNRRSLAQNVSGHFPATITNNKWLYYFSDGELVREIIAK